MAPYSSSQGTSWEEVREGVWKCVNGEGVTCVGVRVSSEIGGDAWG